MIKKYNIRALAISHKLSAISCFVIFNLQLTTFNLYAQQDTNLYPGHAGFTHKSNAKNALKDSLKEGLWLDYIDSTLFITTDTNAPFYTLTYYKDGTPFREIMGFFKNGLLWSERPLSDGKKNGTQKVYYSTGTLNKEIPYSNGIRNGVYKEFFETGILKAEYPYTNGKLSGIQKAYYKNGKLNLEITYDNGQAGETKVYDEKGKEVK